MGVGGAPAHVLRGHAAFMHAATGAPPGLSGFTPTPWRGLSCGSGLLPAHILMFWRSACGESVTPEVEAYWDGRLFALGA